MRGCAFFYELIQFSKFKVRIRTAVETSIWQYVNSLAAHGTAEMSCCISFRSDDSGERPFPVSCDRNALFSGRPFKAHYLFYQRRNRLFESVRQIRFKGDADYFFPIQKLNEPMIEVVKVF